ncbi:MAG: folate family ECF transporter S component [Bacilli bacterium]|nr:folate family ECF transporter S component [Bacilli bacterium]
MLSVTNIKESTKEIKKVSSLTGCAMLTAIKAVIAQFTITVSNILEIGFSGIVVGATGMFYGPWLSGIAGVIADTIEFMLRPSGPYFPGFAINEFLIAFIYGSFFYKKEITWKRVLCAQVLVMLLINMLLTPLWLNIMYGNTFWALFTARIIPQLIKFPVDFFLMYTLLRTLSRLKRN